MSANVAVIAASTRARSINAALARRIVERLERTDTPVDLIDLRDFEMPIYQGDLEAEHGVPAAARELTVRLQDAAVLVIVSPEYNGAFPPVLKNSLDWVTRVDRGAVAHLTMFLASASPGGLGGARVLALLRMWFESMRITVAATALSVPHASLIDDGDELADDPADLNEFVAAIAAARDE